MCSEGTWTRSGRPRSRLTGTSLRQPRTTGLSRIWNVTTGQELTVLRHQDSVRAVAFSPDGRTLATASEDTTARIWDVTTGQERVLAHEGVIRAVAFSPDGRMLATASLDNTTQIWNVATGQQHIVVRYHGPGQSRCVVP